MELYTTLATYFTVISFLVFLGIVAWAYGRRREQAFAAAANEPFALPDDAPPSDPAAERAEPRSR